VLYNISQLLDNDTFIELFKEKKRFFTRDRKLSFKDTVMFPCYFSQSNLQNELNSYFAKFSHDEISSQHIDKSAYSDARKKYKPEIYNEINKKFVDGYYHIPSVKKTFYDCVNEISLESYLVPKSTGERELAKLHMMFRSFDKNDITLYDRGYASICLQKRHLKMGSYFCMRMPTTWGVVKDFLDDKNYTDKIVTVSPNHLTCKECIEESLNPKPYKIRLIKINLTQELQKFSQPLCLLNILH